MARCDVMPPGHNTQVLEEPSSGSFCERPDCEAHYVAHAQAFFRECLLKGWL